MFGKSTYISYFLLSLLAVLSQGAHTVRRAVVHCTPKGAGWMHFAALSCFGSRVRLYPTESGERLHSTRTAGSAGSCSACAPKAPERRSCRGGGGEVVVVVVVVAYYYIDDTC